MNQRAGFTAIEMIVVVMIVVIASSLTLSNLLPAMRKGKVGEAAEVILRAHALAKALSQQEQFSRGTEVYRVQISYDDTARQYLVKVISLPWLNPVAMTPPAADWTADPNRVAKDAGTVVQSWALDRSVAVWANTPQSGGSETELASQSGSLPISALASPSVASSEYWLQWFYAGRSGNLVAQNGAREEVGVPGIMPVPLGGAYPGTNEGSEATSVSVRTIDNRYRMSVAIYRCGAGHAEWLP